MIHPFYKFQIALLHLDIGHKITDLYEHTRVYIVVCLYRRVLRVLNQLLQFPRRRLIGVDRRDVLDPLTQKLHTSFL